MTVGFWARARPANAPTVRLRAAPFLAPRRRRVRSSSRTLRRSLSRAEADAGRTAADALDPDVLVAGEGRVEVRRRHDHLRVERLVVSVAGPIEVGRQNDRVRIRRDRPRRLGGGALEHRAGQHLGGVPPDALSGLTAGERGLCDGVRTAKAAPCVHGCACGVECAAAGQEGGSGRDTGDVGCMEGKADRGARPGRRGDRQGQRGQRHERRQRSA